MNDSVWVDESVVIWKRERPETVTKKVAPPVLVKRHEWTEFTLLLNISTATVDLKSNQHSYLLIDWIASE